MLPHVEGCIPPGREFGCSTPAVNLLRPSGSEMELPKTLPREQSGKESNMLKCPVTAAGLGVVGMV